MTKSLPAMVRVVAVFGLIAMTGLTAAACSRPCAETAVPGLAIAVGTRSNSPMPNMPAGLNGELTKIIDATIGGNAKIGVTVVRVDGNPSIGCGLTFDASAENPIAKEKARSDFPVAVNNAAQAVRAESGEVDVLKALDLAAASAGPGGTVVLIDSGLQTKAPLSFTEPGLLDADADAVVDELAKRDALPKLSDRTVILAGIGYTAAPQKPLDDGRRRHLIDLWTKIVKKAGATSVTVDKTPNTTAAPSGLPAVSQVPVPDLDTISIGCDKTTIFTNDSSVGFLPDSTTFREPNRAESVLAEFGDWLKKNASAHARVTGSIAHYGSDEGNGGLSRARAEKVREVLIQVGARSEQVSAKGEGWGPVPSKDAAPDPASDQLNRRVVIELTCG